MMGKLLDLLKGPNKSLVQLHWRLKENILLQEGKMDNLEFGIMMKESATLRDKGILDPLLRLEFLLIKGLLFLLDLKVQSSFGKPLKQFWKILLNHNYQL